MYFVDQNASVAPAPVSKANSSTLKSKLTLRGKKPVRDRGESLSWGWASIVQKVKHSPIPITVTLTKVVEEDEIEICLEIFKSKRCLSRELCPDYHINLFLLLLFSFILFL